MNNDSYKEYIDIQDIIEILDNLESKPLTDIYESGYKEGYEDGLYDLRCATEVGLSATIQHLINWQGHVPRGHNEHGYCNCLDDVLSSINALIKDRSYI